MRLVPLALVALAVAVLGSTVGQSASGARSACGKTFVAAHAFSADSRWLAIERQRECDALPSLVVIRLDGSRRRTLARAEVGWSWAPKGDGIAFEAVKRGAVSLSLATPTSRKIRTIAHATTFAWSPRGKQVAARRTAPEDIVVAGRAGPVRSLAQAPLGSFRQGHALQWSPDGRSILFTEAGDGASLSIRVVARDGSAEHEITRGRSPAWSPDGSRIVYDSGTSEQPAWRTIRPDASDPRPVGPASCARAVWAPRGRWLMFVACPGATRIIEPEIWVDSPLGGALRDLGSGTPAWAPSGTRLALARPDAVTLVNADGSGRVDLPFGGSAAWSPRGNLLAVGKDAIHLVRANGGGGRVLATGAAPVWAPNGRWIAFARQRSCGQDLDVLRVPRKRVKPVLPCR